MSSLGKISNSLLLIFLILTSLFVSWSITFQPAKAQPSTSIPNPIFNYYDLNYVSSNLTALNGSAIITRGLAKFLGSIYMYEDFWLQDQLNQSAKVAVVVGFANLTIPQPDALIEVRGTVEYISLSGGLFYINASSWEEVKNVILIGWDAVQRDHLFEMLNSGRLSNLTSFVNQNGRLFNITIMDHITDTKAGWTQILTGYRWWRTGVFNNEYWFHSIPRGYTIPERVENYFGKDKVSTAFIVGKLGHMEIQDGTGDAANGRYTHEAIYRNLPSALDVCTNGARNANVVGPSMLQFLENNKDNHFFAFFHFSDPDFAGHASGENSIEYEQAIELCDNWLGQIINKLSALNISQKTLIYLTADHGFDEGALSHWNAPYIFLATNDMNVNRNGDQVDVAPTVYYGLGMWGQNFDPPLDGYPLQVNLPEGVEQDRENKLSDTTKPPEATIVSQNGANIAATVDIRFNASDKYLSAVLLLINDTLKADGPWAWQSKETVVATGTYAWDATSVDPGSYIITVLAFDEHGANNGVSTSTITVYKGVIPEFPKSMILPLFLVATLLAAVFLKRQRNGHASSAKAAYWFSQFSIDEQCL